MTMNILIKLEDNLRIFGSIDGTITDENIDFMENYIFYLLLEFYQN